MHLDARVSEVAERWRADDVEARKPFAMASLVVVLWRNIRACELDAIAMVRWGYSRMRTWLDFSGEGGCPGHQAVDGGGG
jgi:hypothetical protein